MQDFVAELTRWVTGGVPTDRVWLSHLHDQFPERKKEIRWLVLAYEEQVPARIWEGVEQGRNPQHLVEVEIKRLASSTGLSKESTQWAVGVWAASLGLLPASTLPAVPTRAGVAVFAAVGITFRFFS